LHIYFAEGSAQTPRSKRELVERLSSFCGFSNATNMELDRKYLLMNILEDDDLGEIDAMLDRERVPPLVSDGDLADEVERKEKARQVRLRSTATGNVLLTTRFGGIPASQIDNLLLFSVHDWDPSTFVDTDRLLFAHGLTSLNTSSGRIGCIPRFCNLRLFGSGRQRFWRRGLGAIVQDERTLSGGEIFVSSQQFFMLPLKTNILCPCSRCPRCLGIYLAPDTCRASTGPANTVLVPAIVRTPGLRMTRAPLQFRIIVGS